MRIKIKNQINKFDNMKENRDRLLQKQNDRHKNFKELHKSYLELQNRLKAIGKKAYKL